MAGGLFLLMSLIGLTAVGCGLTATLRRQARRGLWLYLAANGTTAAGALIDRAWLIAAANLAVAAVTAWMLWRWRRKRQPGVRSHATPTAPKPGTFWAPSCPIAANLPKAASVMRRPFGSSPIRRYAEGWNSDFLLETTEKAVRYAVSLGLGVMYVTEDTTRCDPETVKQLNSAAISNGARTLVICDTVGHATPLGAAALVKFVLEEVVKPSGEKIQVEWHGHCDRGLAIANSMAALIAGADCVHATALGIGERVGNTQMDQMLVNLKLMGIAPWDGQNLTHLKQYCEAVSAATGVPIPANYPVVGEDAFRTATGVHAAAVIKAYKKKDIELANAVYSGVPSHYFGLEQVIDIGPMSGKSNVLFWLEHRGLAASDAVVERIYKCAKSSDHTLSEAEIMECVHGAS